MAGDDDGPAPVVQGRELRCSNCGAPWTMRGFNTTRTLACEHCGAVIDTSHEPWRTVQTVEGAYKARPRWALGTKGTLDGVRWEVIGWCERSVRAYGQRFAWEEHLLYNPYEGFRYLVHQNGHLALITPLAGLPAGTRTSAAYEGQSYKHFSTGKAVVDEVLGEFPWQMKRGDLAQAEDYVDPPFMLSSEQSEGEVVWSRGRYLEREEALAGLGKPTRDLPSPTGVHPCQPNPHRPLLRWMATVGMAALAVWGLLTFIYIGRRADRHVWSGSVAGDGTTSQDIVLEKGKNLELHATGGVDNSWCFVPVVLVGPLPGEQARYAGLEVSYYHGVDGGESWSEGSHATSEIIPGIPAGKYVLQMHIDPQSPYKGPVTVTAREDVTMWRYPCCSLLLLGVVPLLVLILSGQFEKQRWADSDHAP